MKEPFAVIFRIAQAVLFICEINAFFLREVWHKNSPTAKEPWASENVILL